MDEAQPQPQPRMMIIRMVLENFKSYAGRQEIGPFHKSFTSIVGPNGSGKSNVIDSLLFVFGFRSTKMRQAKLSELIHSSKKFPNLDFCRVEIHFQQIIDRPGPNAYDVVPDSSVIVSRIAYKSNKSQYHVNGKLSSWTEVTDMLRKYGIDLDHKRFLILQGEVESISQMKPKAVNEHEEGLLEYLEDIIGTNKYKQPIEEAAKQIESLNEDRNEKLNRVKLVEKEKAGLEDKRQEAIDYIRSENDLIRKKSHLFQLMEYECRRNIDIVTSRMEKLSENLANEVKKYSAELDEIKALEKSSSKINKEYEKLGVAHAAVLEELSKFNREEIEMQENKKHLATKLKKAEKSLAKERQTVSEQSYMIKNLEEEHTSKVASMNALQSNLAEEEALFDKIRDNLKGKTESIQIEVEKKQSQLAPWTEKIDTLQASINVLSAENKILEEKVNSTQESIAKAKAEQEKVEKAQKDKKSEKEKAFKDKDANLLRQKEIKRELENLIANEASMKKEANEVLNKVEQMRSSLQAFQSRGQVLKSLLQERSANRIPGIYGRLGDLGTIDNKYDVAISTACGALDHIVVDTTETGQRCVEFLRTNNLGRATFICMDKLHREAPDAIRTPENVARLYDLVKPRDPLMAPAFYFALRDTLVAKDLDQANRIAFGTTRFRVVTLDGKLIDISGTMSGGGSRVSRGGMSSVQVQDVTPQEVAEMDQQYESLMAEIKKMADSKKKLQQSLVLLEKEISSFETVVSKIDMDIGAGTERLASLKQQQHELSLQKPNPADLKRMEELQAHISKDSIALSQLRQSAAKIEEEIRSLQAKILEVGGIQLRTHKGKMDLLKEQIDAVSQRLAGIQAQRLGAEKAVEKANKAVTKLAEEVNCLTEELHKLEETISEKTSTVRLVQKRCEEAKNLLDSKKEELDDIKTKLNEKNQLVARIRAVEVELRAQLEKDQRDLDDNKKKQTHWQSLSEQLVLQRIEPEDTEEGKKEDLALPTLPEEQILSLDKDKLKQSITFIEVKLQNIKPNLAVLDEYRKKNEEYTSRAKDLEEVTNSRDQCKAEYDRLRKQRLDEFMEGFGLISQKLKEMYQMITLGGNAELELVDSLDPFSEGIIFSVMPPKKSWKNISNLSGGEKTLSSLALVFALHHFKPTPLYVMDEIDAALDFRNVSIVANYIKERTKDAQFIIISLRNNMFELADRLVGIYKTDSCTKSVAINPVEVLQAVEA